MARAKTAAAGAHGRGAARGSGRAGPHDAVDVRVLTCSPARRASPSSRSAGCCCPSSSAPLLAPLLARVVTGSGAVGLLFRRRWPLIVYGIISRSPPATPPTRRGPIEFSIGASVRRHPVPGLVSCSGSSRSTACRKLALEGAALPARSEGSSAPRSGSEVGAADPVRDHCLMIFGLATFRDAALTAL